MAHKSMMTTPGELPLITAAQRADTARVVAAMEATPPPLRDTEADTLPLLLLEITITTHTSMTHPRAALRVTVQHRRLRDLTDILLAPLPTGNRCDGDPASCLISRVFLAHSNR